MAKREKWGSKLGFILATAGSAVGLGSMFKVPYVTGMNGGGLFVMLYLIFTFSIAIPIFIAELIIGRNTSRGPIAAFAALAKKKPSWKYVGWLAVATTFLVFSYYNVIAGWTLHYTVLSLVQFTKGLTPDQISGTFDSMYASPFLNIFWSAAFASLTGVIVYAGIKKGIEHWSKILMPALFILLIGLFLYSTTLPGFSQAFDFIFSFNMSSMKPSSVVKALGLSFFTISVGFGILVTYGSYMRRGDCITKTAFLVGGITTGVAMLSAMMIFPIIFTFGIEPAAGMGMIFKALPLLFSKLPGTIIISTLFFVLFVFATVTSTISLMEVLVANLMELTNMPRHKATIFCCSAIFIFGIPSALSGSPTMLFDWEGFFGMNFFNTIEMLTDQWLIPISGMLIALFAGWIVDKKMLKEEFQDGSPKIGKLFHVWLVLVRWAVPIAIAIVMLQNLGIIDVDAIFMIDKG